MARGVPVGRAAGIYMAGRGRAAQRGIEGGVALLTWALATLMIVAMKTKRDVEMPGSILFVAIVGDVAIAAVIAVNLWG